MENGTRSSEASETTSSSSSRKGKGKGKGAAFKRRNSRVLVRRHRANNVDTIGLPLGMSFAAVMAQVNDDAKAWFYLTTIMSACYLFCLLHIRQQVFGDKLDGLMSNFEQSFSSTLSTLQLIYESSKSNEGNILNDTNAEIRSSKLIFDKGVCSGDIVTEDAYSRPSHVEIQNQSISRDSPEEVRDNFHTDSVSLDSPEEGRDICHMGSVSRDLTSYGQSNQMVSFSQIFSGSVNNLMVSLIKKSVMEQCRSNELKCRSNELKWRSNELKTRELDLYMESLKLKEDALSAKHDSNNLNRSKLAMGESKASFKAEKFKTQLEDTRHGELKKKCIDCLITGLLIMSSSLLYGAYVYSYERITEATESCTPSTQAITSFNSRLNILWCQVQVMSRMAFGVLMIFAVAYLLLQRSTTSSQTMPVTFIVLMLGVGCGYCGKMCVDTLGGRGDVWLFYWEILCLLHFLSLCWTSALYSILHGSVTAPQTTEKNTIFRYWIRRVLFYGAMLVLLPLFCGLMPFATLGQWKDHFTLKGSDFDGSEW
uniref:Protein CPR-5 n=1 Tax=Cajanus cajan TaxID=3821 RepID=A0A151TQI4_CAJCA|nr:Protein CPR-5 [Cajanus cajan]